MSFWTGVGLYAAGVVSGMALLAVVEAYLLTRIRRSP